MSTVDTRIVVLQFDNQQFEQNVGTSLDSLEKLKNATNLEGSGKGLEALGAKVKNFSFGSLFDGIQTVSDRFSTMGIVGMTAIQNITDKVVNLGLKMVSSIPSKIFGGGWTRAMNIEQAKHQIEGLAGSAQAAADIINGPVNESVAGTAYGLDQAALAASALYTSGIKDLDGMKHVLQAISGTTAASLRGDYDQISNIITQMVSYGRLTGDFANRLMGQGISIKDFLAEAYGTTSEEITSLISKGEISASQTIDLLHKKFADFAYKANDTFTGAAANVNSAFKKIGEKIYVPLISSELKAVNLIAILNSIREAINNIKDALIPVFDVWSDLVIIGGTWLTKFLEPFKDASGIEKFSNGVKSMWENFKDTTSLSFVKDALDAVKEGVEETGEQTKETSESITDNLLSVDEMARRVMHGDYGNGQERIDKLHELGYSWVDIQNRVNELMGSTVRHTAAEEAEWLATRKVAEENEKLAEETKKVTKETKTATKQTSAFSDILGGVRSAVSLVARFLGAIKTGVAPVLKAVGGLLLSIGKVILNVVGAIGRFITSVEESVKNSGFFIQFGHKIRKVFYPVKKVIDTVSKALGKFAEDITKFKAPELKNITKLFDRLRGTLSSFWKTIKSIAGRVKDGILKFIGFDVSEDTNYVESFLSVLDGLAGYVNDAIDAFKGWAGAVGDFLEPFVTPAYDKFLQFVDYVKSLNISFDSVINFFKNAGMVIGAIFSTIYKSVEAFVTGKEFSPTAYLDELSDGGFTEFVDGIRQKLAEIKQNIKDFDVIDAITTWFGKIKTFVSEKFPKIDFNFIKSITTFFEKIRGWFKEKFPKLDFTFLKNTKEFFLGIKEIFTSVFKNDNTSSIDVDAIIDKIASFIKGTKSLVERVKDALTNLTWSDIFKGLKNLVMFISLIRYIWGLGSVFKSLTGVFKGIRSMLDNMGKAEKYTALTEVIKSMSWMFLSLAATIAIISFIPVEKSKDAVLKLGGLLAAIFGFTLILGLLKQNDNIKSFGLSMLQLSGALLMLAIAIAAFSMMPIEMFVDGGLKVLAGLVALSVAARIAGSARPGGFVLMATALLILAPAIEKFSKLDWDDFKEGGKKVAIVMAGLAVAVRAAGRGGIGAALTMLGLVLALYALKPLLMMLSTIDSSSLLAAAGAIAGVLISFGVAAKLLGDKKVGIKTMAAMTIEMLLISFALSKLSGYNWKQIAAAGGSIAGVLLSLAGAAAIISKVKFKKGQGKIMLAMTLMLTAVGASLVLLSRYNWPNVLVSAGAILAVMVALSLLAKQISKGKFNQNNMSAMLVFTGALLLVAASLALLSLYDFTKIIGAAAAILIVFGSLSLAIFALSKLKTGVETSTIVAIVAMLAGVGLVLGALAAFGTEGKDALMMGGGIAIALIGIAAALALLAVVSSALSPAAPIILAFAGAAALLGLAALEVSVGLYLLVDAFLRIAEAGPQAAASVIASMAVFIRGIIDLTPAAIEAIRGILQGIISLAPEATEAMLVIIAAISTALMASIPLLGEIGALFIFGVIYGFLSKVGDLAVAASVAVIEFLDAFQKHFPALVDAAIKAAVAFINGLAYGIHEFNGVILDAVGNLVLSIGETLLTGLYELVWAIPGLGGLVKDALDNVTAQLDANLASVEESAKQTSESITAGYNEGFMGVGGIINSGVSEANSALANGDTSGASLFATNITDAMGGIIPDMGEIGTGGMEEMLGGFLSGDFAGAGKEAGTDILSSFSNVDFSSGGVESIEELISGANSKEGDLMGAIKGLMTKGKDAGMQVDTSDLGEHIADGLIRGLDTKEAIVEAKAARLAEKAKNAIAVVAEVASPSKATMRIGRFMGEGLAIGLQNMELRVVRGSEDLANATLDALRNPISKIADIINSDVDVNPTITPVLDLSQIQNGSKTIGSMLSGTTSYSLASSNAGYTNVKNDDVVEQLSSRLGTMFNEALGRMQDINDKSNYTIEVPVVMNGREVAHVSAPFMRNEINTLDRNQLRKAGVR